MPNRIARILSLSMFLCAGMSAQAQTFSLDATVGPGTGRGGGRNYFGDGGVAGAVTLGLRHQRRSGGIAALTFGSRGRVLSNGDECALEPGPGSVCRPLFPSVTHFGMLGGIERTKSGSTLRLLAGPAVFGGGVRSSLGGQVLIDAAISGEHVAFVMAGRGSVIAPFSHAPIRLGSLEFGLRVQDGTENRAR